MVVCFNSGRSLQSSTLVQTPWLSLRCCDSNHGHIFIPGSDAININHDTMDTVYNTLERKLWDDPNQVGCLVYLLCNYMIMCCILTNLKFGEITYIVRVGPS